MRRRRRIAVGVVSTLLTGLAMLVPAPTPGRAETAPARAEAQQAPGVRVEVRELKRTSGDTLTLRVVVVNDSDQKFRVAEGTSLSVPKIYLLDTANRRKYTVARDEKAKCICSPSPVVKAKSRKEIWAKFGAPPEGVRKLTVVIPQFAPLEDVPIR
jgi:hypothetical protein